MSRAEGSDASSGQRENFVEKVRNERSPARAKNRAKLGEQGRTPPRAKNAQKSTGNELEIKIYQLFRNRKIMNFSLDIVNF